MAKKTKSKDPPKYVQLNLFDFLAEMEELAKSEQAESEPPKFYSKGTTFEGNGFKCFIGMYENGKHFLSVETNGYRAEMSALDDYNIESSEYVEPVPSDTKIAFPAMYFKFFKDGESINGDNWFNIPWLADPELLKMVEQAFGWIAKTTKTMNYCKDFRDLFVMKWMGLERLPSKYKKRIGYTQKSQDEISYYDIEIPLCELFKFMKVKQLTSQ